MERTTESLVVEGTTKQHKTEAQRSTKGNHKEPRSLLLRASLRFPSLCALRGSPSLKSWREYAA